MDRLMDGRMGGWMQEGRKDLELKWIRANSVRFMINDALCSSLVYGIIIGYHYSTIVVLLSPPQFRQLQFDRLVADSQ